MIYNSIIDTIGNTPLVRLNKVNKGIKGEILAKVEYFNPGNSMKDRMAIKMVEDAEKAGLLKPGGTIIEGTSGNTGMGLALAGIAKGYKCIFTMADKQSKEKIDILKAVGAEVIVCPTNVAPDDPRSYYSVARKLNEDIPNSFYPNQYDNLSNWQAHYETTGPEIWKDTEGKVTHYAAGVGTGGTISGASKFLKEQNPDVVSIGIDTYGSVFKKYKETGIFDEKEIYPYILEGIGEDLIPANVDFDLIDHFEKVTDKDAALMTRRMAREEGLLVGYSSGSALQAVVQLQDRLKEGDVVVMILHDHGSRYINKVYNDNWMMERGFLSRSKNVRHVLESKITQDLITAAPDDALRDVLNKITENGISQLPIFQDDHPIGSINETDILNYVIGSPDLLDNSVRSIMQDPFPIVAFDQPIGEVSRLLSRSNTAVLSRDRSGKYQIITSYDLLKNLNC